MAKQTGLGDYLAVDDSGGTARDISNDVTSIQIQTPQAPIDVTGIDKSAMERIVGLNDVSFQLSGVVNAASNKSHTVFATRTGTRTVTYCIGGNSSGNPKLECECLVANYNVSRAADGQLTWQATLNLQSGTTPAWSTV